MKSNWTIRQMFLWVFIVALILPYIVAMIPRQTRTIDASPITSKAMEEWLREVDPSTKVVSVIGRSGTSLDLRESDYDYSITMNSASAQELFKHLEKRLHDQIRNPYLPYIKGRSRGNESFSLIVSDGYFRRHLYLWNMPPDTSNGAFSSTLNEFKMRIKVLQISYRTR